MLGSARRNRPEWVSVSIALAVAVVLAAIVGFLSALGGGVYAAALLLVVVVAGGLMMDYRVGVWALVAFIPLTGTHLIPREMFGITGLNPMNVVMLASLIGYFVNHRRTYREATIPPMDRKMLFMFVGTVLVAGLYGTVRATHIPPGLLSEEPPIVDFDSPKSYFIASLVKPLLYVLFAWLVAAAARDSKKPQWLLWPFMLSALILSVVTFVGIAMSGLSLGELASPHARKTLAWIGLHNNDLGPMFVGAAAVCLYSQGNQSLGLRVCLWVMAGICAIAAMLTFSRMAFLGLIVVVGGYFALGKMSQAGPRILIGLAIALVSLMFMPRAFFDRATTGFSSGITQNSDEDALSAGRVTGVWIPALEDFVKHPDQMLVGGGLEALTWSPAIRNAESGAYFNHPHNGYIRALIDTGVIGFGILLWFWAGIYRLARRLARDDRLSPPEQSMATAAAWGIIVLAVQCLTGGALTPIHSQVFLWSIVGIVFGLQAKLNAQAPATSPSVLPKPYMRSFR